MTRTGSRRVDTDHDRFNDLIHVWNHCKPIDKAARLFQCKQEGHDWWVTPLGSDMETVQMCRRCCKYASSKPRRKTDAREI